MKRWLSLSLLIFLACLLAVALGIRFAVLPIVPQYRDDLERLLGDQIGRPVQVGELKAYWSGLEPWVEVRNLAVLSDDGKPALSLPAVRASLSWSSLAAFDLRLAHLVVESPQLALSRDAQGRYFVAGVEIPAGGEGDSPALAWLLRQGDVQVSDARVVWTDEQRKAAPLYLSDIQFRLSNVVNLHRAALKARLITQAPVEDDRESGAGNDLPGTGVDLQFRFFTPLLGGRPADVSRWKGEVYTGVQSLRLRSLRPWLDLPVWLPDLDGELRSWVDFDALQLRSITVDPQISLLGLYNAETGHGVRLRNLSARLEWQRDFANTQQFSVKDLAVTSQENLRIGPMSGNLSLKDHIDPAERSGRLTANQVDITVLAAALADAPLPKKARQWLEEGNPRGRIDELDARWQGDWQQPRDIRLKAVFGDVGLNSFVPAEGQRLPGFSGLSGRVSSSPDGGRWELSGRSGLIEIHDVLRKNQIRFTNLASEGRWKLGGGPDRWLVLDWDSLDIERDGMRVSMAGDLVFGRGEMPVANLAGAFNRVPATEVAGYMPLVLGDDTLSWLEKGLRAGVAHDGRWRLKGDLWHFPFADRKRGEFSLSARIQKGEVLFQSDWPAIRDIEGEIRFANDVMTVTGKSARTRDVPLSDVTVQIPSLSANETLLTVSGAAQAPLSDMVKYVNTSPVGDMLSGFLKNTRASGPGRLNLNLRVPLSAPEKTEVKGTVTFNDNDVFLMRGIPQLTKARGSLDFTESGLTIRNLTGQALGGPLKVEAATRADNLITVRADGTATVPSLKRYLGVPPTLRASGQTRFLATVQIKPGAGEPDILVESNLQGVALDLPEPFVKKASDAWPLEFRMLPTVMRDGQLLRDEIRLALASTKGPLLAGRIERDRTRGRTDPLRGALAVGEPMVMPDQGIRLNITVPLLDLDQWQRTQFSDTSPLSDDSIGLGPEEASGGVGLLPDRVALRTDTLIFGNKRFQRLNLVANRQRNRWAFDISADEGKGTAVWTPGTGENSAGNLQLNFARLTIPESSAVEVAVIPPDPTDYFEVPALDISVEDMGLGSIRLGRLRLQAVNEGEGNVRQWILREFQITNPDVVLTGKGDWRREQPGQPRRTRIDFKMDVQNAGRVLDRVGMEKLLKGGGGLMTGSLQWKGPPQSFDYATMSGRLLLDIKDGQFLKADPGVARLLGILSLQSLQRRLTLDFSDIFAAGFAFDQIFATASIDNGQLVTRDFKMRGTGASVLMEGQVDLVKETQNLRAVVLPEVNAAGGTLVYSVMMANPAVGLASFLAQLVLKDPLSRAFSFDMKISGTWDDPVVEKVERGAGIDAAPQNSQNPSRRAP